MGLATRVLKSEDMERAQQVTEILDGLGVNVKEVDLTKRYGKWKGIETGTLELWLGPNFTYDGNQQ